MLRVDREEINEFLKPDHFYFESKKFNSISAIYKKGGERKRKGREEGMKKGS